MPDDLHQLRQRIAELEKLLAHLPARSAPPTPVNGFWAYISNSTRDGTNWCWFYDFYQINKASAGYGGWAYGVESGVVGSYADGTQAYNSVEDVNGTGGLGEFGNGTDPANLTGNFALRPAANGAIVWMRAVGSEYWFAYENAVDGSCDES